MLLDASAVGAHAVALTVQRRSRFSDHPVYLMHERESNMSWNECVESTVPGQSTAASESLHLAKR